MTTAAKKTNANRFESKKRSIEEYVDLSLSPEDQLRALIAYPLPSKTYQRKLKFQPTSRFAEQVYDILNHCIYDNHLVKPKINFRSTLPKIWGLCIGYDDDVLYCKFRFNKRFYCLQWFITILAHEMAHQHQWTVQGPHRRTHKKKPLLSHGKTFFVFRERLAEYGIPLKVVYDCDKWWKYQQLMRL